MASEKRSRDARVFRLLVAMLALALLAPLSGCNLTHYEIPIQATGSVTVAYPSAFASVMQRIGPAFAKHSGYGYHGVSQSPSSLVNAIARRSLTPDVYIGSSLTDDQRLTQVTMATKISGDKPLVTWYTRFVTSPVVVAYSPGGSATTQLHAAASGKTPWYQALEAPGVRFGRVAPAQSTLGVDTILVTQLAAQYYHQSNLSQQLLGGSAGTTLSSATALASAIKSGRLDAGFLYLYQAVEAGLPSISLPAPVNLGDFNEAEFYATAHYTAPNGTTFTGAPILYTVTIPSSYHNKDGAVAFVQYLFSNPGYGMLTHAGFITVAPQAEGQQFTIPDGLKGVI